MKTEIRSQKSVFSRRWNSRSILYPLLAILSATAVAQEKQTNAPVTIPAVVVTATRLPEETIAVEKVPANVTVITRETIAQSPAFTLPELLRQQAGFTMMDSAGSFGAHLPPAGLRGYGEKSGTLVLVDGMRATDAGLGYFLWNSVPLANIERVEIIRGGASTIYGEGAAGGVINIITKGAPNKPLAVSGEAAVGNLGYYSGHAELSGRTNIFSYVFSGDRKEWAGWRDGSNFRSWSTLAKVSAETAAGRFTLGHSFHNEYSENAGPLTTAQYQANPHQVSPIVFNRFAFEDRLHRGWLDYAKEFEHGWRVNAKFSGQSYDTDFLAGTGRESGYAGVLQASQDSDLFGRDNAFTFGGEVTSQDFDQRFPTVPTVHDSLLSGAFVQDAFKLTPKTTLTAGLRFDHRRTFLDVPFASPAFRGTKENNVWSPSVSLSQELAEKTSAWLSFSQSYRLPSANDVVSGSPTFASSPSLVPLNARTVEVGLRSERFKWLGGSVGYFHSWVQNDIFTDPALGFGFGANANGDAIRQGVELALKSQPTDWMVLHGNATYTDARFEGGTYDGKRQVLVPEWVLNCGVSFYPAAGWVWTIENQYVGEQVRLNDTVNGLPRNQFNVLNTKLSYQWRQITSYVSVNNLLDRRYEQSPASSLPGAGAQVPMHNPSPGLNFQVGVTATF